MLTLPKRCDVCGRVMTETESGWACPYCGKEVVTDGDLG